MRQSDPGRELQILDAVDFEDHCNVGDIPASLRIWSRTSTSAAFILGGVKGPGS
jgi:hypothetical protein